MKQMAMQLPTWGGKREGAGRKPVGVKAGVWHVTRPVLKPRFPVHVTSMKWPIGQAQISPI